MLHRPCVTLACGLLLSLVLSACGGGGGSDGGGSTGGTPAVAAAVDLPDGASVGSAQWANGDTSSGGQGGSIGGLACGLTGGAFHIHTQLSIYANGTRVAVPAGIGAVGSSGAAGACKYPIHTNDASGKLHVIAATAADYTLGQFFAIWGRALSSGEVGGVSGTVTAWINDNGSLVPVSDPATIVLRDHRQIVLVIGTPPASVASYRWDDPPALAAPVTLLATDTIGTNYWPAGDTTTGGRGQTVAGLECGTMDETYHVHSHLSIFLNGQQLAVPDHVGLLQGPTACTYSTHTHDTSGKLHVEAPAPARFTLGQFFAVWGRPLTTTNVADLAGAPVQAWINDGYDLYRWTGDPGEIELTSHRGITLLVGSAPVSIPAFVWTGN